MLVHLYVPTVLFIKTNLLMKIALDFKILSEVNKLYLI